MLDINQASLSGIILNRLHQQDDPAVLRIYDDVLTEIEPCGKIRIPLHYLYILGNPKVISCHVVDNGMFLTPYLCEDECDNFKASCAGNFDNNYLLEELLSRRMHSHIGLDFVLTNDKYTSELVNISKPAVTSFFDTQLNVEENGDVLIPQYMRNDVFPYERLKCGLIGGAIVLTSFYEEQKIIPVGGAVFTSNKFLTTAYVRELSRMIPENIPEDQKISFISRRIEQDSQCD